MMASSKSSSRLLAHDSLETIEMLGRNARLSAGSRAGQASDGSRAI